GVGGVGRPGPEEPTWPVVGGRGGVGRRGGAVATGDVDGVAAACAAGPAVGDPTVAVERAARRGVAARTAVTGGDRGVVGRRAARGGAAGDVAGVGGRRLAAEEPARPAVRRGGVGGGGGAVAAGDVDGGAATGPAGAAVGVPAVAVERGPGLRAAARPTVARGDRRVVRRRATG